MIRKYLQLARLPNVFTSPSNIVAGYLTITPVSDLNFASLGMLMLSSALLYISGVVFNDYFDIEVDKKERPFRPLPSGSISKQRAMQLALVLMASAVVLAFFVSWLSFIIAIFLSCAILSYDYRLKHSKFFGPITMGSTRFLNVILGASPNIYLPIQPYFLQPLFAASSMFAYVVIIALFSRKEISGIQSRKQTIILFSFVYAITASIAIATLLDLFKMWSFVILVPFIIILGIIFKQTLSGDASAIQRAIKNMVIAIIILDSIFVGGTAGLPYGLFTLLFLLPSVLLSRKFYVT
ncbi:MAG: UbiA family prenyltransferase [Nitrosotalea sp.]